MAEKINEGVYWVGVQDPDLRIFDIVMTTEYGTSYNSYLIMGGEKTVLIETVKDKFFDEFLANLQEVTALEKIDYLIVNHTEPDHVGSVEKLLEKIPGLTVVGSETALEFLKDIVNRKFKAQPVGDGDKIDLGGKTLRFISAPFLHWPDSMYTYLEEDSILFTCDSFGCHYSDERLFNDLMEEDFTEAYKYYFDVIISPFKPYVLEALGKIKDLKISTICPGHGPILRRDIPHYLEMYRTWSEQPVKGEGEKPAIVMAYVSAYGYTEMLADMIVDGILTVDDFEVNRYDLVDADLDEVMEKINSADGLLIGSPTINGDALPPIWQLLTRLSPIVHAGKVAAAFGAYGWSGEAVPSIEARLSSLRMKVQPGLKVKFKPSEGELEEAFKMGMDFAKVIQQKTQDSSQKQWRCLICGYIHEGAQPPEVCPACGVGPENFEELLPEDEFNLNTDEQFVIIGSGIAALSAARAIRQRNKTAKILMTTVENHLPYYRPALSDLLSENLEGERLYPFGPEWYKENQIEVWLGTPITGIDTKAKQLTSAGGETITYSKLIIATGSRSNIPPFKGLENEGVYALRSLDDALQIKQAIQPGKKAVVIGGGVLGLEAVWEMASSGMEVSVVEFSPRLMPRQLDEAASSRLQDLITAQGIKLYLGVATEEIMGDGKVNGVRLNNGETLPADLVLLSTGVKPNVELAQQAGINVKQGIIVDERMRTDAADVYAAGDVAQFGERLIGLWPVAMEMGKIAGASAAGDWLEYSQPLISTMLAAFGKEIFSVGDVNQAPDQCRVVEVIDPVEGYYKKSYLKDGVLVGEIIIADQVDATESMQKLGRDSTGKKRYNRWKCRVCGYIHEGPEPPDFCPVCGVAKDMFDPVE